MGNCFSIKSKKVSSKKINNEYVHEHHDVMFHEYINGHKDICKSLENSGSSFYNCLLYTSPSPRDLSTSRMPSSA